MKKLAFIAATTLAFAGSLFTLAPVFAASPGYLAGGPDIYQVRNVTKNTSYGSSASVACNETVKYSIKLSNTEYGLLSNVTVKAPLSGAMSASATNAANETVSTTGTVAVTPAAGNFSYITGSTQLFDVNGTLIKSLPDGITTNGVNAGTLNGSTREFVQFQAKLNCETPPTPPKNITVCELATKKIITIDEKNFDTTKHSKDLDKCKEVPPTKMTVCELATKKVVTIEESKFDATKYSKDLNDCKETTVPGKIEVCEVSTKTVVMINENEFDSAKYSKDLNDCGHVLAETPTELPSTGPAGIVLQVLGASSLAGALAAYARSRKLLG